METGFDCRYTEMSDVSLLYVWKNHRDTKCISTRV